MLLINHLLSYINMSNALNTPKTKSMYYEIIRRLSIPAHLNGIAYEASVSISPNHNKYCISATLFKHGEPVDIYYIDIDYSPNQRDVQAELLTRTYNQSLVGKVINWFKRG